MNDFKGRKTGLFKIWFGSGIVFTEVSGDGLGDIEKGLFLESSDSGLRFAVNVERDQGKLL